MKFSERTLVTASRKLRLSDALDTVRAQTNCRWISVRNAPSQFWVFATCAGDRDADLLHAGQLVPRGELRALREAVVSGAAFVSGDYAATMWSGRLFVEVARFENSDVDTRGVVERVLEVLDGSGIEADVVVLGERRIVAMLPSR